MADRFYQVAVGGGMPNNVVEAGSTSAGSPVELRVTYDATGINKMQVLKALEAIKYYITTDTFPPV